MVEELLVDSLRVLVGEQAANSQLLVDEVGHSELLTYKLRGELRRQEPAVAQQRWSLRTERRTGVILSTRVRQTVRLVRVLSVPQPTLDGMSSRPTQGAQMGGRGQE